MTTAAPRSAWSPRCRWFNDEIDEVIAAVGDGSLFDDPVVTHEFAVRDALEAFAVAGDPATSSKVLLRF